MDDWAVATELPRHAGLVFVKAESQSRRVLLIVKPQMYSPASVLGSAVLIDPISRKSL